MAIFYVYSMKKIFSILVFLFSVTIAFADGLKIDKEGLVTNDGVSLFYLVKKNSTFLSSDFSWQNLQHQEVAYLRLGKGEYNYNTNSNQMVYNATFAKTGSTCTINNFTSLSVQKSLARTLSQTEIINADGSVNFEKERTFVLSYNGRYFAPKDATMDNRNDNVIVVENRTNNAVIASNTSNSSNAPASNLLLKNNKIYLNKELFGNYEMQTADGHTMVTIVSTEGVKTVEAKHEKNAEEWQLTNLLTNKKTSIIYTEAEPLQDLIMYCINKKILQQ